MRRKPSIDPLLYRILHGSSSTVLDPVRARGAEGPRPSLFRNSVLDRSIVFKLPHFGDAEAMASRPGVDDLAGFDGSRPIETGVYIPDNHEAPAAGGYVVYLRQTGARKAFADRVGIDIDRPGDAADDVELLRLLDDLPSLDPFLVKLRFEHAGRAFPSHAVAIREEEERAVRRLIDMRIGPIMKAAFAGRGGEERTLRLMEGIWDPSLPEARGFVAAFGLPEETSAEVLFAVKGVGFYEYLFARTAAGAKEVHAYLAEDAASPTDSFRYKPKELAALEELRLQALRLFMDHDRRGADIFAAYDDALAAFTAKGDPRPFRRFLAGISDTFWALGHCVTARSSAHAILADSLAALRPAYAYENVETVLERLRATLRPRAL